MSTWSTSDWLMFRPVLALAFVFVAALAAWAAAAIRRQWITFQAKRSAARALVAARVTMPKGLADELMLQR